MHPRLLAALVAGVVVATACTPASPSAQSTASMSPTEASTARPSTPSTPLPSPSPSQAPATAHITARITLPTDPGAYPQTAFSDQLAVTDGAIWVVWWSTDPNSLIRIDATAGSISKTVQLPYPVALAAGDGGLWAVGPTDSAPSPEFTSLYRVDLATGSLRELAPIRYGGRGFQAGLGSLWSEGDGGLWQMQEATGARTAAYPLPTPGSGSAIGCGAFWWLDSDGENTKLARFDPGRGVFEEPVVTSFFAARPIGTPERCWLVSPYSVQPLVGSVPGDPIVDADVIIAGDSVWALTRDVVRRIDLETGLPIEPGWRIDPLLLERAEKGGGIDFRDAGGFLWLLNRDQVTRFDIPTS